jgi:hypothetical protein
MRSKYRLQNQERSGAESQNEPNIKIEEQISNIECPRLDTEDVRTLAPRAKDIVGYNVPGYHDKFSVEKTINGDFKALEKVSIRAIIRDLFPTRTRRHLATPSMNL